MGLASRLGQSVIEPTHVTSGRADSVPLAQAADYVQVKHDVQESLMEAIAGQPGSLTLDATRLESLVFEAISQVLTRNPRPLSGGDRARLVQEVIDDVLGNGPLEPLLRDPEVTEIMVNRFDTIYTERHGRIYPTGLRFAHEAHLRQVIDRIVSRVGRRVDEASPMVDARLPDGSRVNATVPPIAVDGANLTIRKFAREPFTTTDLITTATLTRASIEFLHACVQGKLNILISGGTGSGKTTTLNVLSSLIDDAERIVTVEDAAELQLLQPHVVRLEARPANVEGQGLVTVRDLVRNSLRMRPDRIIVGEVRDAAALDMLQAMNTGHEGSMSTVHANSPRDALSRVETMVLMAGMDLPMRAIREQIGRAIGLVVHQARLRDGSRHVTSISEITGLEGEVITMQELFTFEYSSSEDSGKLGRLVPTGVIPQFLDSLSDRGVHLSTSVFTPQVR